MPSYEFQIQFSVGRKSNHALYANFIGSWAYHKLFSSISFVGASGALCCRFLNIQTIFEMFERISFTTTPLTLHDSGSLGSYPSQVKSCSKCNGCLEKGVRFCVDWVVVRWGCGGWHYPLSLGRGQVVVVRALATLLLPSLQCRLVLLELITPSRIHLEKEIDKWQESSASWGKSYVFLMQIDCSKIFEPFDENRPWPKWPWSSAIFS